MAIRSTLEQFASRRANVVALLGVAFLACGFAVWRVAGAPASQRHTEAGIQLMLAKSPTQAEREWLEAVRLDPGNAQAWTLLGDYYQAAALWPQATEAFAQALKASPESAEARADLAQCALKNGDVNNARTQAESALARDKSNITAMKVLADIAESLQDDASRVKYLRRIADLSPGDVGVLEALADTLILKTDYAEARAVAERILKLRPDSSSARIARATALFNEDPSPAGLSGAKADFEAVLKADASQVEAQRYLGRIAMRQGQPRAAIAHFEAVGRGRPYALAHFVELAAAYRKAGDARQADSLTRRFERAEKFNTRMRDLRDRLQRKSTKFDNALELGRLLLASVEEDSDSYHLFQYRYRERKIDAVGFYLDTALQLRPGDARALAAQRRLAAAYSRYLQGGLLDLQKRDAQGAADNFARLVLLRPRDVRTLNATRQVAP